MIKQIRNNHGRKIYFATQERDIDDLPQQFLIEDKVTMPNGQTGQVFETGIYQMENGAFVRYYEIVMPKNKDDLEIQAKIERALEDFNGLLVESFVLHVIPEGKLLEFNAPTNSDIFKDFVEGVDFD